MTKSIPSPSAAFSCAKYFDQAQQDMLNKNAVSTFRSQSSSNQVFLDHSNNNASQQITRRIPELQMINKLYGLVPKKFVINERVNHNSDATAAFKAFSVTGLGSVGRPKARSGNSKGIPRQSSFDSLLQQSENDKPNLSSGPETSSKYPRPFSSAAALGNNATKTSSSQPTTPLITKRMPFTKNYTKVLKSNLKLFQSPSIAATKKKKEQQQRPSSTAPQRVLHIDLNRMRWTEEDDDDQVVVKSQNPDGAIEIESSNKNKLKSMRKAISFDESTLLGHRDKENGLSSGAPVTVVQESNTSNKKPATSVNNANAEDRKRPTTAAAYGNNASSKYGSIQKNPTSASVPTDNKGTIGTESASSGQPPQPWTTGKTTAERRAKFQKSFSIHPSSIDDSGGIGLNSFDYGIDESEPETNAAFYPDKRSSGKKKHCTLHVENIVDDVETLVSDSIKKNNARSSSVSGVLDDPIIKSFTKMASSSSLSPINTNSRRFITRSLSLDEKHDLETAKLTPNHLSGPVMKPSPLLPTKIRSGSSSNAFATASGGFNEPSAALRQQIPSKGQHSAVTGDNIKRGALKKSNSLPEEEKESPSKMKVKSNTSSSTVTTSTSKRPPLIKSKSVSFQDHHPDVNVTTKNLSSVSTGFVGSISNNNNNKRNNNSNTHNKNPKLFQKKPITELMTTTKGISRGGGDSSSSMGKLRLNKRPKTAPTNITTTSANNNNNNNNKVTNNRSNFSANNGNNRIVISAATATAATGSNSINSNRRQPMKVKRLSSFSMLENANSNSDRNNRPAAALKEDEGQTNNTIEKTDNINEENSTLVQQPFKSSFAQRSTYLKLLRQPVRRRSLSFDDDLLLKYTTGINKNSNSGNNNNSTSGEPEESKGSLNTEVEPEPGHGRLIPLATATGTGIKPTLMPMPSASKKTEECLKIYRKLSKIGCGVRLETIFRGMMSPIEYDDFMCTILELTEGTKKKEAQLITSAEEEEELTSNSERALVNENCNTNTAISLAEGKPHN